MRSAAVGDKEDIYCHHCDSIQPVTYDNADLKIENTPKLKTPAVISGILAAKCDTCGKNARLPIVSIEAVENTMYSALRKSCKKAGDQKLNKACKTMLMHGIELSAIPRHYLKYATEFIGGGGLSRNNVLGFLVPHDEEDLFAEMVQYLEPIYITTGSVERFNTRFDTDNKSVRSISHVNPYFEDSDFLCIASVPVYKYESFSLIDDEIKRMIDK